MFRRRSTQPGRLRGPAHSPRSGSHRQRTGSQFLPAAPPPPTHAPCMEIIVLISWCFRCERALEKQVLHQLRFRDRLILADVIAMPVTDFPCRVDQRAKPRAASAGIAANWRPASLRVLAPAAARSRADRHATAVCRWRLAPVQRCLSCPSSCPFLCRLFTVISPGMFLCCTVCDNGDAVKRLSLQVAVQPPANA